MLYNVESRNEDQASAAGAKESRCTIRGLEQRLSFAPAALARKEPVSWPRHCCESRYPGSAARARRTSRCSGSGVGLADWVAQGRRPLNSVVSRVAEMKKTVLIFGGVIAIIGGSISAINYAMSE